MNDFIMIDAMQQPIQTAQVTPDDPVKKSEIVIAVMSRRLGLSSAEKKLYRDLCFVLERQSMPLEEWDGVNPADRR